MDTPESHVNIGRVRTFPNPAPTGSSGPTSSPSTPGGVIPHQPVPDSQGRAAAETESRQARESKVRLSVGSSVFLAGFGLSFLLLVLEYLTAGEFPGWFILIPTNPSTLLAALVGHQVEAVVGSRWSDEAFFGTLVVESALWWYMVGALVAVVRRRRAHRLMSETENFGKTP
ncbi:MAG: hypothetical protein WD451_12205 [Thermoanaerobaculia bacterium]